MAMSSVRVAFPHTHVVIVMALAMLLGVIAGNTVALSDPNATASERTTDASNPKAGGFFGTPLPGASPLNTQLVDKLKSAWQARNSTYKPRTRHLNSDGSPLYTNRLFHRALNADLVCLSA